MHQPSFIAKPYFRYQTEMATEESTNTNSKKGEWPVHGSIGFVLIILFWFINWTLAGLRTHYLFFPLWLGYALFVDALVVLRTGTSLYTRNQDAYARLFLVSIPAWWLFELFNVRLENWEYAGKQFIPDLEYAITASICFSTVIPAVFGSAELVRSYNLFERMKVSFTFPLNKLTLLGFFASGWLWIFLILAWPIYFFPLVWGAVYLIIDPINHALGFRSLLGSVSKGDWRPVGTLCLGCLICGFFWEMWNFFSYPKWIYHVPFVDFLHIFEMPLLGYIGYFPFALELYALYHFVTGLLRLPERESYIQV